MTIENITHQPHSFPWPQVYRAYYKGTVYFGNSYAEVIKMVCGDYLLADRP